MNDSDPNIVKRLNQMPPYTDEQGNIIDKAIPQVETPVETEGPGKPEPEVPIETPAEEPEVENPVEEPKEPTEEEALANAKNPERTRKFVDKLKEQNEQLKRKPILDSLAPEPTQWPQAPVTNQVPTPEQFPGLTQTKINEVFKGMVDSDGFLDSGQLFTELTKEQEKSKALQEEVKKSRQEVQQTNQRLDDFERTQIMRGIHDKYPKLNPVNVGEVPEEKKFDDRLWQYVQKNMVTEWVNETASGKIDTTKTKAQQDAERLDRLSKKGMELLEADALNDEGEVDITRLTMKKADKQKLTEAELAKKNINARSGNMSGQRNTYTDHEALVQATRNGVPGSLAERLRRAGQ